eukprot:753888-Hanusia_phi.AAC.1
MAYKKKLGEGERDEEGGWKSFAMFFRSESKEEGISGAGKGKRSQIEDSAIDRNFKGNPAAVIEICDDEFPPSRVLQMMAEENNLSVMHIAVFHGDARGLSFPPQETAFWKRRGTSSEDDVLVADLRWLTPQVE